VRMADGERWLIDWGTWVSTAALRTQVSMRRRILSGILSATDHRHWSLSQLNNSTCHPSFEECLRR
jgi:hypothetical protein